MPDDIQTEGRSRWEGLTETGAGTPMGELLRRYWWPIAGASEFAEPGTKPARLKDQIRIKAYPVEELGGLLWAYLGPEPRPLVPDWEFFSWKNGFRQIVLAEIPCNWFQCQENSIDPVHFEWTHSNWSVRLAGAAGPYTPQHVKVDFSEFDYGFQYKRIRTDTSDKDRLWTVGRVCLWPNGLFTGNHVEFRVPVDDENTLSVMWHFSRVPREREPYVQNSIPTWQGPIADPETGRWITSHVMNQDFVTWVGQGRIADRSQEYLAPSDRGIVMIRRRFLADIEGVKEGRDPKAVVRDPAKNRAIELPVAERKNFIDGFSRADMMRDPFNRRNLQGYIFQTGQPPEVREAFLAAMGFTQAELEPEPAAFDPLAPAPRNV